MRDLDDGALMKIILGSKAFGFDFEGGSVIDPMLIRGALELLTNSPSGSSAQQRGALVVLLLSCPELRPYLPSMTARVGWDPAPLGGHVFSLIERMGGDPSAAVDALVGALRDREAPKPVPAPAKAPARPAEPAPGKSEGHRITLAPKVDAEGG